MATSRKIELSIGVIGGFLLRRSFGCGSTALGHPWFSLIVVMESYRIHNFGV